MENRMKKTALAILGLSAALLSASVQAITLTGTQVSYSFNSADLGLFGTASLSGDTLVFTPSSFRATSTNGSLGSAFQTLHITVSANSGYYLSAINLTESGSYNLSGVGALAFVTGNITALDIEGTTGNQAIGTLAASAPLNVMSTTTGWVANAGVNLPTTGWGGGDGVVGSIGLKITNQLFAVSSPLGGVADIWKNTVSFNAVTSPIPEAETYAMMLAGLGLIGFMVGRRSRASA